MNYTGGNLAQDMMQREAVLKNVMDLNFRERVGEFSEEVNDQYCINKDSDLGIYYIIWCVSGEFLLISTVLHFVICFALVES
jgi:predicted lipid carrier protein YhbT